MTDVGSNHGQTSLYVALAAGLISLGVGIWFLAVREHRRRVWYERFKGSTFLESARLNAAFDLLVFVLGPAVMIVFGLVLTGGWLWILLFR